MITNLIKTINQGNYPIVENVSVDLNRKYAGDYFIDDEVIRCRKIKLHFDMNQFDTIRHWFRLYDQIYNVAVKYAKYNPMFNLVKIRDLVKPLLPQWLMVDIEKYKLPSHTVDNAIRDVAKAIKTCRANLREKNIRKFRLRYKKLNRTVQTITLEKSAFSKNKNTFCGRTFGNLIRSSEPFGNIEGDCRLQRRKGKVNPFTLYIPNHLKIKMPVERGEVCSIDPGVRTFLTCYDKERSFDLGADTSKRVKSIVTRIESNKQFEGRRWYKKLSSRLYDKITHITDDIQYKAAKWLTQNYDRVIIGKLSTKGIIRTGGNLTPVTRNITNLLSHFTFRQRLISCGKNMQVMWLQSMKPTRLKHAVDVVK